MLTAQALNGRFSFPTPTLFGPGCVAAGAVEIAALGKRALIVTDNGLIRSGLIERIGSLLQNAGMEYVVYDGVHGNPTEDDVMAGLQLLNDTQADVIVAVGGGSPIDAAKMIRLLQHHPFPIEQYDDLIDGGRLVTKPLLPMVAIPTTSGTGSEVSRSAVITPTATGRKTVVFSPRLIPSLAVCDPELTLGLSPRMTAATGADALTHAVEAYVAKGFHPLADALALQGVTYVFRYLRRAVINPADIEARSYMMLASMFGAIAFQKGLGACHSMAHALSAVHETHHGLANAVCLPSVVAFNAMAVGDRMRDLDRAVGNGIGLLSNVDAVSHFQHELKALLYDAGIPSRLSAIGIGYPEVPRLVAYALSDGCHASNPRQVSEMDFTTLFQDVM